MRESNAWRDCYLYEEALQRENHRCRRPVTRGPGKVFRIGDDYCDDQLQAHVQLRYPLNVYLRMLLDSLLDRIERACLRFKYAFRPTPGPQRKQLDSHRQKQLALPGPRRR